MTAALKLPVLMECTRLRAKLTEANCASRWRRGQEGELFPESLAICARCEVGKAKAENSNG